MLAKKTVSVLVLSSVLVSATTYGLISFFAEEEPRHYVTDPDFVMESYVISPDGRFRMLVYRFDAGAFGEGRSFWAVTPTDYSNLNLASFELPDGYAATGWSENSELIVETFEPYYYRTKLGDLKTGDTFNGATVRLIEKDSREHQSAKEPAGVKRGQVASG